MGCYEEPQHDVGARTTAISVAEGRMKVDIGAKRKRHIIKKRLKSLNK